MLDIKGLCVDYKSRRGDARVVDDVSFNLQRGEILGLVGESGAGKSTVGSAIMGLLDTGGIISGGTVDFDGTDLSKLSPEKMRQMRGRRIGMIFQNPLTSLNPVRKIGDQLTESIVSILGLSRQDARKRAIEWLERMQLPNPAERIDYYPHQFSGGQRQRIVIALALCGEPDLLIADEPTTALDVSVQEEILGLMKQLVEETNVGVILVTHNMGVVAKMTDRIAIMRHGKMAETGQTRALLGAPRTDYARMLIASVPPADRRLNRLPVPDQQGKLLDVSDESPISPKATEQSILTVKDLDVTYHGSAGAFGKSQAFKALSSVNFDLKTGHSLAIVGESGSGKSTCARAVVGVAPISNGTVSFRDLEVSTMKERERRPLRSGMQMIFQDPYSSLNQRMTIRDLIAEPLRFYRIATNRNEITDRVAALLKDVHMPPDVMSRYPHQFSGGQRQRIAIARTLASAPSLIICDEPTSALDVSVQAQVLNLIKDLQEEHGLSLLFISHDLPVVRQMCDDVIVLKEGQVVEHAPAEQFFEDPQDAYSRHLLKLMPRLH